MRRLFKIGADRHDPGKVVFAWHPDGSFLASAGRNGVVQITDRHSDIIDEIPMTTPAPILSLAWDANGETLAILQDGNGTIPLWYSSNRKISPLDTNLKEPSFIAWSKKGALLAVGTQKGNLLIYDKLKKKKVPIVGKHGKRISCGAWSNSGNKLVLGSDDRSITVSIENGDTIIQHELKSAPSQVAFSTQRYLLGAAGASSGDNTVSAVLNGKSIFIMNIVDEKDDPTELSFPEASNGSGCKYGEIVSHEWIDESLLMVVFSGGYVVSVSTGLKTLGEEKLVSRLHSSIATCSYNPHLRRTATAGDDGVRIMDVKDFKEVRTDFISREDLEDGRITSIAWSPDGQILTIATAAGNVYNFLAKMNTLCAAHRTTVAYLSSLKEVSVVDVVRRSRPVDIALKLEPAVLAVGPRHVAAAMNTQAYFHRIASTQVFDQSYSSTIRELQLNDEFVAALLDSSLVLHFIEPSSEASQAYGMKSFPGKDDPTSTGKITCMALTDQFLFYGTESGTVDVFYIQEKVMLSSAQLRLEHNSVKRLYPNHNGTRVVVVDSANQVFLYNPVTGGGGVQPLIRFEETPAGGVTNVLWDIKDTNVICLYDGKSLHTYVYSQATMKGSILTKLGPMVVAPDGSIDLTPEKIDIGGGNSPLVSCGGLLTCQTPGGGLSSILHPYYDCIVEASAAAAAGATGGAPAADRSIDKKFIANRFCQALALLKLDIAWLSALQLDKRQFWLSLSGKAMEHLNVELACRIYRQLGDAGMVMALYELQQVEDRLQLAGQVAMLFFCDYQRAQDLFLASSRPIAAVEMRRNLLQWDQALKLARALGSSDTAEICLNFAQQLEFRDDPIRALEMYETTLKDLDANDRQSTSVPIEHIVLQADMGLARCNIKNGKHAVGISKAKKIGDRQLFIDCGDILQQEKQYAYAVDMYQRAEQFEKAGSIYVNILIPQDKNDRNRITEAAAIMAKVKNDKLNVEFGKMCSFAGRHDEAAKAYERARDMEKTIEIKLRHLDQVQQAFDIVRETASAQGAIIVADYCLEKSDYRGVLEFQLIANKVDDAFNVAQSQGMMDTFTQILGDAITTETALKVAVYFEKMQEFSKAAKYFTITGSYPRALKLYMKCGEKEIDAAIELVGKSRSDELKNQLLDFLEDIHRGTQNCNYIYKLYMAWKKYDEAAKTALILARQEQDEGNYPYAHQIIVETTRKLEEIRRKVPLQIRQMFVLLHSYMLVKIFAKKGDHEGAARLLVRVAQSVSKFPKHLVPILTSTVIECQRAGMKSSAYEYATMLMRPEYRQEIPDPLLRKKIEAIVRRRSAQSEESPEETSPCPISGEPIPGTQLECPTTRDALPMCVVTGRHILLNDCCLCPNSKLPAIYSEYVKFIRSEVERQKAQNLQQQEEAGSASAVVTVECLDPVLGQPVSLDDLKVLSAEEVTKYIQRYNNVFGEGEGVDLEDSSAAVGSGSSGNGKKKHKGANKAMRDARMARRERKQQQQLQQQHQQQQSLHREGK